MPDPPASDQALSPLLKTALFWGLAQVPLAGGALATLGGPAGVWARVELHPVGAVVLAVGYQAGVLAVSLLKKVWAAREPKMVEALAALADSGWARVRIWVSRFRRLYLRQIWYDHRTFNVRGMRSQGAFSIRLEKVFVELRVVPKGAGEASLDPLGGVGKEKEISGNKPIWEFLHLMAKEEAVALAILGAPGCGKTTLLQNIALVLAANKQRKYKLRSYVPVLLFLRDHVSVITGEAPPSLGALAQEVFKKQVPPPGWFERQLKAGACLVLLDGLDEVAEDKARKKVSAWVEEQISAYPRSPFVLTARPLGYRSAPLKRAHVLEVQPFGSEQVKRFIQGWYLANEIMKAGDKEDEGVRQQATKQANDLLQRLYKRPALGELTRNPLLLTMIATVHSTRNALPGRRVELYAEICDVLLGHWRVAKGISDPLTAAQLRVVLEPLAAHMMRERTRELRASEVLEVIEEPLGRVGVTGEGVKSFLPALQAASGLLLERENDRWSFVHLTFQEYLAAAYFRGQNTALHWGALLKDSWWHETLRLYAAQGDATALIRAGLMADEVPALTLMAECLDEAKEIEPPVRAQAVKRLTEDLESEDEGRRHIAAEVRLTRRLRSLHRIDEQREIDLDYVSCAEYQIFLNEQYSRGVLRQPDHWTAYRFPAGQAEKPIGGVRPADAQAFVEWLTARQGGGSNYRLPTSADAEAYPAQTSQGMASWSYTKEEWSLTGLDSGIERTFFEHTSSPSALPRLSVREIALALDLDLARDRDRARALGLDLDLARARARGRALDLGLDLGLDLDRDLDRDRDLGRALGLDRDLALDFDRALDFDLLSKENIAQTRHRVEQWMGKRSVQKQRAGQLLLDLLDRATAETPRALRQAQLRYAAHLTEYAWIGYETLQPPAPRPWHRRWLSRPPTNKTPDTENRRALLALHWWFVMALARLEGTLPAWEGIRIVRERRPM